MITLLLGLFIILYSISQVDQKKLAQVADSIRAGFGYGPGGSLAILEGGTSVLEDEIFQPRSQLFRIWENLGFTLKRWKDSAKLRLGLAETEELKLVLFSPVSGEGSWVLDPVQDETYKSLAELTKTMDVEILIRLEIPDRSGSARTSWEESANRTARLAEILERDYNIPRNKIAILAHTEFSPVEGGDLSSPEAKAKQERIEIFLRKKK
jgi:chemotaxis protein MotB